jgi:hypothetical protein
MQLDLLFVFKEPWRLSFDNTCTRILESKKQILFTFALILIVYEMKSYGIIQWSILREKSTCETPWCIELVEMISMSICYVRKIFPEKL